MIAFLCSHIHLTSIRFRWGDLVGWDTRTILLWIVTYYCISCLFWPVYRCTLSNTTNIVLMLESYLESTLFIKSINWSLVLFLYSSVYTFGHLYNHRHQQMYWEFLLSLCFFYLGLCGGTPWWTAIYVFAAIGPSFSSWYNSTESGDVLYLNSSILFFLIRI